MSKKVTILINSDFGKEGTIGFRALEIARLLKQKNCLNNIICRDSFDTNFTKYITKIIPFGNFFPKIFTGINYYISDKFIASIWNLKLFDELLYRHIINNKDKYSNNIIFTYEPCLKSLLLLKELNCKIIMDIQMSYYDEYISFIENGNFKKIDAKKNKKLMNTYISKRQKSIIAFTNKQYNKISPYAYQELSFKLVDKIIFPSKIAKQSFNDIVKSGKGIIIPFGVDIHKYKAKSKKNKKLIFSFLGAVEERKGIHYLINAWNKLNLKNAQLIIAGRIHKKFSIIAKKRYDNIIFTGFSNPIDILTKTNVFIFPSFLEGSAKVVYEAMAAKCAIITTNRAGSIIQNNKEGIVINLNNEEQFNTELQNAILKLYSDRKLRTNFGNNAYNKIKKYSWTIYAEKIVKELT